MSRDTGLGTTREGPTRPDRRTVDQMSRRPRIPRINLNNQERELFQLLTANDPADNAGTVRQDDQRKRQAKFLARWVETADVRQAAEYAEISTLTTNLWLKDPTYAEMHNMCRGIIGLRLEAEAIRRATEGVERGIWHQGLLVGTERTFSDTLLVTLLKSFRKPDYTDQPTADQVADAAAATLEKRNRALLANPEAREMLYKLNAALGAGRTPALPTHTDNTDVVDVTTAED